VTDHRDHDLLRETFVAHEHLAPESADVYAKVQQIAKGYRLRRIGLQAAGGAVLTAGLVAGAIQLPQFLVGDSSAGTNAAAPAASAVAGTADDEKAALAAFEKAGYQAVDTKALALQWKMKYATAADVRAVKIEAGRRLLAGETLPPPIVVQDFLTPTERAAVDEFYKQGYSYTDAVNLMKVWHLKGDDAYTGKIAGGKALLAGKKLPVKHQDDPAPADTPEGSSADDHAFAAFFNAGYDYDDAVRLAKIWKMDKNDIGAVKIAAGKKLLAHKKLPVTP
jgi:hypothetical protein